VVRAPQGSTVVVGPDNQSTVVACSGVAAFQLCESGLSQGHQQDNHGELNQKVFGFKHRLSPENCLFSIQTDQQGLDNRQS
jgi:hypothetical protein